MKISRAISVVFCSGLLNQVGLMYLGLSVMMAAVVGLQDRVLQEMRLLDTSLIPESGLEGVISDQR